MKNVLIINQYGSTPDSGFGGRTFYLAKSLARYMNVTLVCGSYHHQLRSGVHQKSHAYDGCVNQFLLHVLKIFKCANSRSPLRIVNWFIFSIQLCFLSKAAIGFKPSCIIYSSPALPGYFGAFVLARRFSCPLLFEVRDIWPLSVIELGSFNGRNLLVMLLSKIEKFAYQTADGVISNLYDLPRHICKIGCKPASFHFSPNGVDCNISEVKKDEKFPNEIDQLLYQLNSWRDAGKTIVGYVGGLAPANSLDLLIETAAIAQNDFDLVFIVIGNGPEKERLEAKCLDLGLANVQFYPAVPKRYVSLALSALDVLFLANHFKEIYSYGVSPMKLPEYLLSTKPIIHVTNSRSLLDDVGCWEVVREHDPKAVLKSLYKIKKMPVEEKLYAGFQSKTYVKSNLNYDSIGDSLLEFLNDLCT